MLKGSRGMLPRNLGDLGRVESFLVTVSILHKDLMMFENISLLIIPGYQGISFSSVQFAIMKTSQLRMLENIWMRALPSLHG